MSRKKKDNNNNFYKDKPIKEGEESRKCKINKKGRESMRIRLEEKPSKRKKMEGGRDKG